MKPISIISSALISVKKATAEVLALLHCNDASFRQTPVPAINSVPGGSTFTPYGPDFYGWFGDQPPLEGSPGSYSTGDEAGVLHSNTKFDFPGQFCLEGFFLPLPYGGTCLEIADGGSALYETATSFVACVFYASGEDADFMYIQSGLWGRIAGGPVIHFDSGPSIPLSKNGPPVQVHVAFYRDADNYLYLTANGELRNKSNAPFPGTISGYVNLGGGYDNTNGELVRGGFREKITEFRVTRGSSVYGVPPFVSPTTRFTLP